VSLADFSNNAPQLASAPEEAIPKLNIPTQSVSEETSQDLRRSGRHEQVASPRSR